ncbi:olfactory receptor 10A7-like [Bombina bombina]|uniref:olfactory receptor 10A7-like n=1 Tax=Bombina bombina TaxID=8345 RepID=UPI00235A780E|nr:olfactory receptor 10A7-like [Bombina bombina]
MNNHTIFRDFHILAFSAKEDNQLLLFVMFFFIYIIGVSGNFVMITLVFVDANLHTSMYLFLSNLSVVDIGFTTTILPKLLDILLTGNNTISILQCFTQLYFYLLFGSTEILLLSSMAYDRSVAICNPLNYHRIMTNKKCVLILGITWLSGCLNALFYTCVAANIPLCLSNEIHYFYCDGKALTKIACSDKRFSFVLLAEALLFLLFPFLLILVSYTKIISSILQMNSQESRRKSFSTCTSHITVLTIFYGSALCIYLRPPSEHTERLDHVFGVLYTSVTPMLNPLIYSLRNKDVRSAIRKLRVQNFGLS